LMDTAAPEWRKQWADAIDADKRTHKTDATDKFLETMLNKAAEYTGQSERTFFRSGVAAHGAWQKIQFSESGKALREHEQKAMNILSSSLGDAFWSRESGANSTFGQRLMDTFKKDVVTEKMSMNKWMENFKELDQGKQNNIRATFESLLTDIKKSSPQNVESVASMSIEDLMSKAVGTGAILEKLDQSISGLNNLLAQIPAFIKGAADKWGIDLNTQQEVG